MKIASTIRSRLPRHAADLLRPRLLWIVMAASTLAAAGAIQHGIDRLEIASAARAQLERDALGLHERYLAAAAPTTPALQKLRAERDAAVADAAGAARATVWASLLWMMGLGAAGAWLQQRRARTARCEAALAGAADSLPPVDQALRERADRVRGDRDIFTAPGACSTRSTCSIPSADGADSASPVTAPDWQALRQEICAIGELIGTDASASADGSADAPTASPPRAELHRLPARLPGSREPLQLALRLAA